MFTAPSSARVDVIHNTIKPQGLEPFNFQLSLAYLRIKELHESYFMAVDSSYNSMEYRENLHKLVSLECKVEKMITPDKIYTEQQIKEEQNSFILSGTPVQAYISSFGYSKHRKEIVCGRHYVDKIVAD